MSNKFSFAYFRPTHRADWVRAYRIERLFLTHGIPGCDPEEPLIRHPRTGETCRVEYRSGDGTFDLAQYAASVYLAPQHRDRCDAMALRPAGSVVAAQARRQYRDELTELFGVEPAAEALRAERRV